MRIIHNLYLTVFLCLVGCFNSHEPAEKIELVISQCIEEIENNTQGEFSIEIDHIYVDEFKNGYSVSFSHGSVGTFGKRSADQKSIWGCGVTEGTIVFLGNLSFPAVIDELDKYPFEDYSQDVKEYLFTRKEDELRFCCMQLFDEKNVDKNNPGFFEK